MLHELEVRNLGIIDSLRLELPAGFTVLTGETGAGKSLLVQSLQLLAGERAGADQVRSGSDRLLVQGTFSRPNGGAASELFAELGLDRGEELVVRREVTTGGRSRAWVNDVPVTVGSLQRLAPFLLSVHGQHEQRGLSDPATHLHLVDLSGGLEPAVEEVARAFEAWEQCRAALAARRTALAGRRDRLDVIAFQLRELEEAALRPGEEVELREERTWLQHAERIAELLATAQGELAGDRGSVALARAARAVRALAELGLPVAETAQALEQAQWLAEEAERELGRLADRSPVDPRRLETVEVRLALLERLARKYGGSIASALDHLEALRQERAELEGVEDDIAELEVAEREYAAAYLERARDLSSQRRAAAERLCQGVVAVAGRLAMPGVQLVFQFGLRASPTGPLTVDGVAVEPSPRGIDTGELLVTTNPGEPLRPLARVASGGELSRLHLAIRTVLRDLSLHRQPLTLLFDEVDAGIGGHVADELGRLLAELGRRDQVLAVTHLPQVASRASCHLAVRKVTAKGRSVTRIERLQGESRVDELVRMLGGGTATPSARQHARELLGET
jgi:DNA repair protein RecN (Recombination protein N)